MAYVFPNLLFASHLGWEELDTIIPNMPGSIEAMRPDPLPCESRPMEVIEPFP